MTEQNVQYLCTNEIGGEFNFYSLDFFIELRSHLQNAVD